MDVQISKWAMEREQVEVSYTARGALMKVDISRYTMRCDHWRISQTTRWEEKNSQIARTVERRK
jgi:hypothetical protein